MAKRLAENQLTPDELSKQLNEDANGTKTQGLELADKQTIDQRKIVRVKRHLPNDQVQTEEVKGGVFKLIGSLDTKGAKDAAASSGVQEPLFKPFNFSQSTFGGQTIPVQAQMNKVDLS